MQRTPVASLTPLFQHVEGSIGGIPGGADLDQCAQEPHRLLGFRREDCGRTRRVMVRLKGHGPRIDNA
ncbi:hypothetical protein LRC537489_16570 [Mycobacterium riyadhense]